MAFHNCARRKRKTNFYDETMKKYRHLWVRGLMVTGLGFEFRDWSSNPIG